MYILITNNAITRQDMGWETGTKVLPGLMELASLFKFTPSWVRVWMEGNASGACLSHHATLVYMLVRCVWFTSLAICHFYHTQPIFFCIFLFDSHSYTIIINFPDITVLS